MIHVKPLSNTLVTDLRAFRRLLHQYPELSLQEYQTTERIRDFLRRFGIEPLDCPLETGVIALIRGKKSGPCVAIRSDIDALPIFETTNLSFKSAIDGKMHACGHDFHTAAALGGLLLAKEIADSADSFAGSILFIFQPAEEIGVGASMVVDTGIFHDHHVCAIIGEHNNPLLSSGYIGVKPGPLMGSVDEFKIAVHGCGGHAAQPELTVDPIVIAAQIISGLQHIVSRNVPPLQSAVVTIGKFQAGTARNVIPTEAVFEGTVRTLEPKIRDVIEERIRSFVEDTARAYGGRTTIEYIRQLPSVMNHEMITQIVREGAEAVVGSAFVTTAVPTLAGEDFSFYQQMIPGCFFFVGTGKSDGTSPGWHHPDFDVDESMIHVTSQILIESALRMLNFFALQ